MASPGHPTANMENLPGEVLSDIFMRLLAKQLAQMRCVCKSWNALLSESSFVKSHLHHSMHNNEKILLFFDEDFSFNCGSFTAHPSRSPDLKLTNFIKLPDIPQSKCTYGNVIGSTNGLICFYYKSHPADYVVCIWNPSLSAILTLPPCSLPSCQLNFGFAYDPKADDYKVVRLTSLFEPLAMKPKVEVYSMRKGSWESISQSFPSRLIMITDQTQVCVDGHDGHLHWLCDVDLEGKQQMIYALDLGVETFSEIPLPDSILDYGVHKCFSVLGILAGKLCVMSCVEYGQCEVWVMNEYQVSESWVKHHAFSQFSADIVPYGFTLHNEFLFRVDLDHFALYDPMAAKTKTFKVRDKVYKARKVVEYVDSLVWVAPAKH